MCLSRHAAGLHAVIPGVYHYYANHHHANLAGGGVSSADDVSIIQHTLSTAATSHWPLTQAHPQQQQQHHNYQPQHVQPSGGSATATASSPFVSFYTQPVINHVPIPAAAKPATASVPTPPVPGSQHHQQSQSVVGSAGGKKNLSVYAISFTPPAPAANAATAAPTATLAGDADVDARGAGDDEEEGEVVETDEEEDGEGDDDSNNAPVLLRPIVPPVAVIPVSASATAKAPTVVSKTSWSDVTDQEEIETKKQQLAPPVSASTTTTSATTTSGINNSGINNSKWGLDPVAMLVCIVISRLCSVPHHFFLSMQSTDSLVKKLVSGKAPQPVPLKPQAATSAVGAPSTISTSTAALPSTPPTHPARAKPAGGGNNTNTKYKVIMCRNWMRFGGCNREHCTFAHGKKPAVSAPLFSHSSL